MAELDTLLFVSRSRIAEGEENAAIEAILETGKARNHELGVTGALMFTGRYFAEVLEGPPSSLDVLMKSIQADDRHTDVKIVERKSVPRRLYTCWDMAYHGPASYVSKRIEPLFGVMDPPAVRQLMILIHCLMKH